MKKQNPSIHENYMLIRDDEGWKILHPVHGAILVGTVEYDGFCLPKSLKVEKAVVYNDELGEIGVLDEVDDITDALDLLESDGHTKGDIAKMNPRVEKIATFV